MLVHLGQWCLNITWSDRILSNLRGVYGVYKSYRTKIITYYKNYSKIRFQKNCFHCKKLQFHHDISSRQKSMKLWLPSASRSLHNSAALWFRTAKAWRSFSPGSSRRVESRNRLQQHHLSEAIHAASTAKDPGSRKNGANFFEKNWGNEIQSWYPAFCWRTCFLYYYWMAFKKTGFSKVKHLESPSKGVPGRELTWAIGTWMNRTLQRCSSQPPFPTPRLHR